MKLGETKKELFAASILEINGCLSIDASSFNLFHSKAGTKRFIRVIAPIVGAGVMFAVIYTGVYNDIVVDACIAAVFAVLGYLIQMRSKGEDIQFRTYDDIYYGR